MSKNVRLPFVLMGAALFSFLSASVFAGSASACRYERRVPIVYTVTPRPMYSSPHTRQADRITTGSVDRVEKQVLTEEETKRVEDCMAIWDPGTHMTKTQWRRTCRSLLGEY